MIDVANCIFFLSFPSPLAPFYLLLLPFFSFCTFNASLYFFPNCYFLVHFLLTSFIVSLLLRVVAFDVVRLRCAIWFSSLLGEFGLLSPPRGAFGNLPIWGWLVGASRFPLSFPSQPTRKNTG